MTDGPQPPPGRRRPRPEPALRQRSWTDFILPASILLLVAALASVAFAAVRWLAPAGEPVAVPQLVGMQLGDARAAAQHTGVEVHVVARRPDFHAPKDRILGQLPAAGERVRQGRSLDVIVSDGVPTVQVPNLSNLSLRDATVALQNTRLDVGRVVEQRNLEVIAGIVLSQHPEPFAAVPAGTKVDVVVATGRPLVYAPNFVGLPLAFAEAAAKEAGIKLDKASYLPVRPSAPPKGIVEQQAPAPGQTILPEQKISFAVSGGAPPSPEPSPFALESPQPNAEGASPFPTSALTSPNAERRLQVSVALPSSATLQHVRVILQDATGARTLYDGQTTGGYSLSFEVTVAGGGLLETYLNDALVSTTPL